MKRDTISNFLFKIKKDTIDNILVWILVLTIIFISTLIPVDRNCCCNEDKTLDEQVKECFIKQKEDTPECKYLLFKAGKRN